MNSFHLVIFFFPPAIFTLYTQCSEISDKTHVLVSLGYTQNIQQMLVYYGSIICKCYSVVWVII